MDRLAARLSLARRTLKRLRELCDRTPVSEIERDAAIQRFEYCFEATWKTARLHLDERDGVVVGSPKAAIRASLASGLFSEEDARRALVMADDRNLTVHTYNEALAARIYRDLAGHAALLGRWIAGMEGRAPEP